MFCPACDAEIVERAPYPAPVEYPTDCPACGAGLEYDVTAGEDGRAVLRVRLSTLTDT